MSYPREYCRNCSLDFPLGHLSNRGYCRECVKERVLEARQQMTAHEGPIYEKWRVNYIAAMSGVINRLRKDI